MSNQLGQRTYDVLQQGQPVVHLQASIRHTAENEWAMTQHLRVDMLNAPAYTSTQELMFSGTPPYALVTAHFRRQSQALDQEVTLEKSRRRLRSPHQRGITTQCSDRTSTLDWTFTLNDRLSLERQLTEQTPIGSVVILSQYLDTATAWRGARTPARTAQPRGFILTSKDDDSVIELDTQRRLIRFYRTASVQLSP